MLLANQLTGRPSRTWPRAGIRRDNQRRPHQRRGCPCVTVSSRRLRARSCSSSRRACIASSVCRCAVKSRSNPVSRVIVAVLILVGVPPALHPSTVPSGNTNRYVFSHHSCVCRCPDLVDAAPSTRGRSSACTREHPRLGRAVLWRETGTAHEIARPSAPRWSPDPGPAAAGRRFERAAKPLFPLAHLRFDAVRSTGLPGAFGDVPNQVDFRRRPDARRDWLAPRRPPPARP